MATSLPYRTCGSTSPAARSSALGANGAGKTTLLSIITGMTRANEGRVRVAGFDPTGEPMQVRSRIGLAGQELALYPC
jgi:ABC-2 type transport system ATP-binding protein